VASYASQEEHDYFQVLTKHNFIISKLVQEFYITLYCTNIHSYGTITSQHTLAMGI